MRHVPLLVPLLAIAILLAALWWLPAPPALAQSGAAPATCRVGAYVTTLHAFDPEADTVNADVWLWSVCPAADRRPLETIAFVNADQIDGLLDVADTPSWASR